ncbi:hypothetical protein MBCUT_06450 [Methanobrevibacter cuticularis]|uniref:Uncharacterized protein n=1 Tax=Methanobrevibacter cuticularis TaxID=47311 RepID=A0A166CT21_9EURY|nr:hypothetical protein [Methanobrevibacter cuticularis]KZX16607.1 hypothetical protein MBCUT_06450 [Methanobrevibacter cuticularis]
MNNKKIIILLLFLGIMAVSISSVNAITLDEKTEAKKLLNSINSDIPIINSFKKGDILSLTEISKNNKEFKVIKVKTVEHYSSGGAIVKKNGKYQSKYRNYDKIRITDLFFEKKNNDQYKYYDWEIKEIYDKTTGYSYVPAKKGDWIKVYSTSPPKTIETKGKVYKIKYYTILQAINSKKAKKIKTVGEKALIGYYNIYKMPTFKYGQYKWANFKGNTFTYGKSYLGYYINHLKDYGYYNSYHRVYKISPKTSNFLGSNIFSKKPTTFKIYVKA